IVGKRDHMVAIPADTTAHVQKNLRQIQQHAGNFVSDRLGRMVMASVEAKKFFARDGVAQVKLVRADNVTLAPNAEELGLDGVDVELRGNGLFKNGVE